MRIRIQLCQYPTQLGQVATVDFYKNALFHRTHISKFLKYANFATKLTFRSQSNPRINKKLTSSTFIKPILRIMFVCSYFHVIMKYLQVCHTFYIIFGSEVVLTSWGKGFMRESFHGGKEFLMNFHEAPDFSLLFELRSDISYKKKFS